MVFVWKRGHHPEEEGGVGGWKGDGNGEEGQGVEPWEGGDVNVGSGALGGVAT